MRADGVELTRQFQVHEELPMPATPLKLDRPLRGRIYDSIAETIGNTPLVRIPRILAEEGVDADIVLKLEFFNPLASVKDRIGVNLIQALEAAGKLGPDTVIRQHRHRAGLRRRRARLQADPHHAGVGFDRAAQDAGLSRRAARTDAAREGHERRRGAGQ
jgi:hypothetical protein